jgi:hypothetical protein
MKRISLSVGYCHDCEKLWYTDRRRARAVARQHPEHKSVYRCSVNPNLWHVGGLHPRVMEGQFTRTEFYRGGAA